MGRIIFAVLCLGFGLASAGPGHAGPVIDRIVAKKEIRLGVRADAPPFSAMREGVAEGFTVDLCRMLTEAVRLEQGLGTLAVTTVVVGAEDRFSALQEGRIDVLCGATTITLDRMDLVDFTIPIFDTGVTVLVSPDASYDVATALMDPRLADLPPHRLQRALRGAKFGARASTTAEQWLRDDLARVVGDIEIVLMADHAHGIAAAERGEIDAYFADLAILNGQLRSLGQDGRLTVSRNVVTYEPYALAIPLGDDDLRVILNRALRSIFISEQIYPVYEKHFGPLAPEVREFYRLGDMGH